MQQKTDEDVKSNASVQGIKIDRPRPRTRAYIKQETEDTKESLKCALYSPVKIEAPSLDINKYESSNHMANLNNICIPITRTKPKRDLSKTPDANDPNNYCMACNFTYKGRSNYYKHLINMHHMLHLRLPRTRYSKYTKPVINMLSLYCDACMKTYDTKKSYVKHLIRHHRMILSNVSSELGNFDPSNLYCKVCDVMYKTKYSFIRHLRRVHNTALPSGPDLIPNVNDKNNYCISCDITLCNSKSYLQHLSSVHLEEKPELYRGIDCKSPSKKDIRLKRYCADCAKVFRQKFLYNIHLDKIHGTKSAEYFPTANDLDVNHCTLCDKTLRSKNAYRCHILKVHNMIVTFRKPTIDRNTTVVLDLVKKYCNVCNSVFNTLKSYRSHCFAYHHIKFGLTKSLSSRVNRNEIPVIDEINDFCTACDKEYACKASYRKHLFSIHGIALPRTGRNASHINHDIIPDMNDKRNHCASCNRTYSNKFTYKRHLASIHDMKKIGIKQEDANEKLNIRSVQTN
ncbi:hypothetical protein MFLAVUS_008393 [Mucor flavus]|uniref:C2H2-type domain-containing protein n=1 Tax=Mucor flavus TaxID=439312 RepID=A0ABP9Z6Z5_9FUNG